ncbi:MAG TPA: 50S ribosomal protein L18 [Spirochaetota bacterium]|nr:50S ribosomal protein L18 [Spirochaetota bacterium]HOR44023.1 50S ribosomal protein L18 [Spirochaetota bacterium]HOU84091.1 50S ribosomal protein L18 [Spirochaetota bacterium]HPK56312.1 50S ribosomal protein L18 [Spirochaetota bacterium]HQE58058.1 50S ribosomal protein L18 [Spirochaetota bacterium]
MNSLKAKFNRLVRRKVRIKSRIKTDAKGRLRLCISKSNKSMYAQIIDDEKQVTVVSMSTLSKDFSSLKNKVNKDAAKQLGQKLAEKAKAAGVVKVVFDRNGFLYHGKIKSFADSARENGLEF